MNWLRKKTTWIGIGLASLAIVVAFFVTSFVLADVHDVSVVTEWQTWFGIVKKATETPPEEIVETAKAVVAPLKSMIGA